MVGAIDFLREWVSLCKNNKCKGCELFLHGVCPNMLEKMTDEQITRTVAVVRAIKLRNDQENKEADE